MKQCQVSCFSFSTQFREVQDSEYYAIAYRIYNGETQIAYTTKCLSCADHKVVQYTKGVILYLKIVEFRALLDLLQSVGIHRKCWSLIKHRYVWKHHMQGNHVEGGAIRAFPYREVCEARISPFSSSLSASQRELNITWKIWFRPFIVPLCWVLINIQVSTHWTRKCQEFRTLQR